MSDPRYSFSTSVDERTGRVMAVYFKLRQGEVDETREVVEGKAFADYAADGSLLGVELLGPCDIAVLDALAEEEPESVRRFFRRVSPREMVLV